MTDIVEELYYHAYRAEAPERVLHLLKEAADTIHRYRVWRSESAPVAKVVNNNQTGNTAIVEVTCAPPTLDVGTVLYRDASRL